MARKILVTDDEPDLELIIRQKFRSRIQSGEFHFDFAFNGSDALDKLKADPGIEIVLTDINMPVMNGLELLANIKSHAFEVKTIVVSAYGDEKNIRNAMNQGAFDFINKPIDLVDLETTIKKTFHELDILKQGKEAQKNLDAALIEKAAAQAEALKNLQEKEKLILHQNELLESQVAERTKEIVLQKEVIELKNQEILESIHYAKRLQEAILPELGLLSKISAHHFLINQPKDIVSGDFYWMRALPDKMFAVADCTGHGVSGALMSMLGTSLLNRIIDNLALTDPGSILNTLHELVVESLRQHESSSNEGMDIALITLNETSKEIKYAGANRPFWIIRNNELIILNADKIPVGGTQYPNRTGFSTQTIALENGDRFYLFSDGYADQFGGPEGKKLMTKNFKDLLLSTSRIPMKEQGAELLHFIKEWKGNNEQLDDILVTGFEINL